MSRFCFLPANQVTPLILSAPQSCWQHQSVLLEEAIAALAIHPEGRYVDGTFGRGGHTQKILDTLGPKGQLLALDRDPQAVAAGLARFPEDARIHLRHSPFSLLADQIAGHQWGGIVNGILLDLGVSSPQLDDPDRGFSFYRDGPLDMRMDATTGETAGQWLSRATESEIAQVLRDYGEERYHQRIARAIVAARGRGPLTSTHQLANIVAEANPHWERDKHPATRSFQGIRIYLNRELEELAAVLPQAVAALAPGGRLAVISFHSLEDRIVKRFFRRESRGEPLPRDLPIRVSELHLRLREVGDPIRSSTAELAANPRARSAILRVAERLAG